MEGAKYYAEGRLAALGLEVAHMQLICVTIMS